MPEDVPLFEVPRMDELSIPELKELEKVFYLLHKYAKHRKQEQMLLQNGMAPCANTHACHHREAWDGLPEAYKWPKS